MKIKILLAVGFVFAVFMAGCLLSPNKGPEVWRFINKFNKVGDSVKSELTNQNESSEIKRIENGQAILDQINKDDGLSFKESLRKDLERLKSAGDLQTTETTERALDNCLTNNVQKFFDIYKAKSDSIAEKIEAYESAKAEYEKTKSKKKLAEMKDLIEQLKTDREVLNKLRNLFRSFKSILK